MNTSSFTITVPTDPDTAKLSAIVYAEASANPVHTDEMEAIASVARNRVEHGDTYNADRKWFGGPGYESVLSKQGEFLAYGNGRYNRFLSGTLGTAAEVAAAQSAISAAERVKAASASPYTYFWFQKGSTSPSYRAEPQPTKHGAHNFWSFKAECVDPYNRDCKIK